MCQKENNSIGILAYPHAQRSAIYGLVDLFETADRLHQAETPSEAKHRLRVEVLETLSERQSLRSAIVVPPSLTEDPAADCDAYAKELKRMHRHGTLVCSVCAGAFFLAQAGLLKGRTATTHWALAETFRKRYPDIQLDIDKLIIDDGNIITAGGLMAWIDLGLKLVDRYLGSTTMLATARYLLVDPGGREQRFYSVFSPSLNHGDQAVLNIQHWLQKHYAQSVTVKEMAEHANLSIRTFIRRFQQATALSPSEYLQHLRVGQARSLMESSKLTVDKIAWKVGYNDASAFRRVFQKLLGLTPQEYRYRFKTT